MTTLRFETEINRPLQEVYGLARRVERHPEFIADYLSCKILERRGEDLLLERTAMIRGKVHPWRSWVHFVEDQGLYFVHQGGRLDGMLVSWEFSSKGPSCTAMTITQAFHVRMPLPWVGSLFEKIVIAPKLSDIARRVIQSFKQACESSVEAVA